MALASQYTVFFGISECLTALRDTPQLEKSVKKSMFGVSALWMLGVGFNRPSREASCPNWPSTPTVPIG